MPCCMSMSTRIHVGLENKVAIRNGPSYIITDISILSQRTASRGSMAPSTRTFSTAISGGSDISRVTFESQV